jgi:hypothetical protein
MRKGYARLLGDEQDLEAQCAALAKAGCFELIIEREGGPAAVQRLNTQLGRLSAADQLVVHRLEALAPDVPVLMNAMALAVSAGATIKVLSPTPLRLCPSSIDELDGPVADDGRFSDLDALAVARALDHPFRLMIFRAIYATGEAGLERRRIPVPAPMAGAALTTHLRALDEARLIEPRRSGGEVLYVARRVPLQKLLAWLAEPQDRIACED